MVWEEPETFRYIYKITSSAPGEIEPETHFETEIMIDNVANDLEEASITSFIQDLVNSLIEMGMTNWHVEKWVNDDAVWTYVSDE